MKGWLPRAGIVASGTPGLFDGDHSFFYGWALVIEWRAFVLEITFARSDEVTK